MEDSRYDYDNDGAPIPDSWLLDVNVSANRDLIEPPVDPANYDYVYYFDGDIGTFQKPWSSDEAFWPTVLTYGLTFTLGILGNLLVVFALMLDRKSRNVTSYFLVSLALADVVFLVVCVPYETLMKMKKLWAGGPVLCKMAGFVEMLSATATVNNLMAVSIERYVVIVHPMKSRSWCTTGNTKKIIMSVWLIAFLLSAPILHIMVKMTQKEDLRRMFWIPIGDELIVLNTKKIKSFIYSQVKYKPDEIEIS
ncbi:hypothetical protein LSH36_1031g00021 [Paralvinella palmiformis]|uniref:G-protein coupled receptors family 1 profile domain-containing protein n=1 Tax=Paralvinella palmiformis TaxID=53620 RepID=A0AAD9IX11_9ANNE|nr:hypothetical protein LSH36_1031g00021 [Paralvinella palmiformis]